ncbi:putative Zn finger protein [Rhodococcus sp. LBL1]|nr:putative Zn finger protein [Rhodococcus sp. LBL1]MDH6683646.1 putative Zn finger protein [Rhodococcus sp. LBL2]
MADNEFGRTAWGMDWVRLAESLSQSRQERQLLPRARSLARNNCVQATVEGRIVRAAIHRGDQASVTQLEVAPLTRASITAIAEIVPDTTVLTDAAHAAIVSAGITLMPVLADTDCSCAARSAPCLHLLAVFYEMARRVEENPRLALDVQGYSPVGLRDSEVTTPGARWTPISTLDPAAFFETASG